MKKLLTLFILALSLVGFSSYSYAAEKGAEVKCAEGDKECMEKQKMKKKKKGADDEEPECD